MATVEFCAGLLIRSQIRGYLDRLVFSGVNISYHETKGWIDSVFIIKGREVDINVVVSHLQSRYDDTN